MSELFFSDTMGVLFREGQSFDTRSLRWISSDLSKPHDCVAIDPVSAAGKLLNMKGTRKLPVGVIGPRDANAGQYSMGEAFGRSLTQLGFVVICGGRTGAMEAVCKGVHEAGGVSIGILPDEDWSSANAYVDLPIATGLGEARNALIATASFALVAVGGGYGTLSEIALGLRLGKLVITMPDSFDVAGATKCTTVEEAIEFIARRFLALDLS